MRYAIKNVRRQVRAYQLGGGSAMEQRLIRAGRIRVLPGGRYELFSQEAVSGRGEQARAGDYFKVDEVDGQYYPYPNERYYFETNHRLVEGTQDLYEQVCRPLPVWIRGDPAGPELQFLLDSGRLTLHPDCPQRYFRAELWGTTLSAAQDAVLVFYRVEHAANGTVTDAEFNFVERGMFRQTYTFCTADGTPEPEA